MEQNIVWHEGKVKQNDREKNLHQRGVVLWFTGLSGSGKSTVSTELEKHLYAIGCHTYTLDGDNIRHGLNSDLSFSTDDRKENIRRIGEVAQLFADSGTITLTAFISPFREDRAKVRSLLKSDEFIEIYVECSIEECARRDVKGLYKKAKAGEIKDFTGISSPYETPENPEIIVNTEKETLEESVSKIIDYLMENKILKYQPSDDLEYQI